MKERKECRLCEGYGELFIADKWVECSRCEGSGEEADIDKE